MKIKRFQIRKEYLNKTKKTTNGLHVPQDDFSVSAGGPPLIQIFG
jgi:hypothetical protein